MSKTPDGKIRQQITKNNEKGEQNKADLEEVEKKIEVAEKDLEIATSEGREAGDYPFWVSKQGKQHVVNTLKDERFNLTWSNDLLESVGRGLREKLIKGSEYRNWVKRNKQELEETERVIEWMLDEIRRLKVVDNENKSRLSELTERGISTGTEFENVAWDHWGNYNLTQATVNQKTKLTEKASKIKERLRE